MQELLGDKLLREKLITEEQLSQAVERQQKQGGRLGKNLVTLGFVSEEDLKRIFLPRPRVPATLEDTGLELDFISELLLKHILFLGSFSLSEIANRVKLPLSIVDEAIEALRREKCVEVKGAAGYAKVTYSFTITGVGKTRATELLDICRYSGPAPVPLDYYISMVKAQTIKHIVVGEDEVVNAFEHIVIDRSLLRRIGPAISSGKATFLYGPPGNGKTTIAETMGRVLPETVYMPYSVIIGGQIISVFDSVNHVPVLQETPDETVDQRWLQVKRPVIMTGGELTLKMLDLDYNPITNFYEAPLQMKANNGLFIVDDFGRQQMDPQNLLNRWIVPLERRTDFLTLNTGMKFEIPFDQLVIFSTNLDPKDLVDDAFLRRIRYKIKIDHPSEEEYKIIFTRVCSSNGIAFNEDAFMHLINNFYKERGVKLNACHPRDLIDHIVDNAHYYNHPPELTKDSITDAWDNYFVEI